MIRLMTLSLGFVHIRHVHLMPCKVIVRMLLNCDIYIYSGGGTYGAPGAHAPPPPKLQHTDCASTTFLH